MDSSRHRFHTLNRVIRPTDWPLATKVTALCVSIAVVLAVALTGMGYFQAEDGLRRQAEGALRSDALLVANSVDQWNQQRLQDLNALAAVPAVRRVVAGGANADPASAQIVQELLDTEDRARMDVNSFALIDGSGLYFLSSTQDVLGTSVPNRDYFQASIHGNPFVSGMTVSLSTGATVLFHSAPVRDETGKIVGVIRSRATLDGIQQVVADAEQRLGADITGVLLDQNGLVITTTVDRGWVLRPVVPLSSEIERGLMAGSQWGKDKPAPPALDEVDLRPAVGATVPTIFDWHTGDTEYHAVAMPLVNTKWTYVAAMPSATFKVAARDFLRNAEVGAGLGIALAALLATLLARRLAKATNRVARSAALVAEQDLPAFVRVAQGLAAGDLTQSATVSAQLVEVPSHDEIGFLATSFNRMISGLQATGSAFASMSDNLRALVKQVQVSATDVSIAAHDLNGSAAETGAASQQMNQALQHVAAGAADTSRYAQNTSAAVERLMQVIEELDRGATQQAHHVQAASERVAAMTAGVEQVAAHAENVSSSSQLTRAAADNGVLAVRDTIAGMDEIQDVVMQATLSVQELGELGERIGAVVETIDGIAEQTNLLALNAAIEAARAGEHGRGFAIVADEVRKLAERSQTETKGIAELIGSVQASTKRAVEAMKTGALKVSLGSSRAGQAGRALEEILQAVEATVSQVDEIAASAQAIAGDAHWVTESIGTINGVVQDNTAACEEMTVRARDVNQAIRSITAVAEEQRAAAEAVSHGAETMSAQVDEMSDQAQSLAMTAQKLTALVSRFKVEEAQADESPADLEERLAA